MALEEFELSSIAELLVSPAIVFFNLSQERKPYIYFIVVSRVFRSQNLLEVVAETLLHYHNCVVEQLSNLLVALLEVTPVLVHKLRGM